MEKVELVIFDMDGLMFDTERLANISWKAVGKKYNYTLDDSVIKSAMGLNARSIKDVFCNAYGKDFPFTKLRAEKKEMVYEMIDKNGLPIKEGLVDCIDFLESSHILKAVASSSPLKVIHHYLELAKLTNRFDFIISGDDVKNSKPDPEIFLRACEKLNVDHKNALVLEDSINGIKAAYNGNIRGVLIPDLINPTEEIEKLAFKKLSSLSFVPNLIKDINN